MEKQARQILLLYFSLTFFVSWSIDLLKIILSSKFSFPLSNEALFTSFFQYFTQKNAALQPLIIVSIVWGPAIAAIIALTAVKGRVGLKELFAQFSVRRFLMVGVFRAMWIHLFFVSTSLAVGYIASGLSPIQFAPKVPLSLSLLFLLYLIIFTGVAEEIGWRGVALPYLQKLYSPYKASVILGVIWGIWHFPLAIWSGLSAPQLLPITLIGLLAGTVGWTIVVTWLYNSTKNLWVIIFLHGLGNFAVSYGLLSTNYPAANIFYGFAPWLLVFILEKRLGKNFIENIVDISHAT